MPFYRDLSRDTVRGRRTLERLVELRDQFDAQGLPERNLESTLLIATWNLREFDSASYGLRTDESIQYIAEIVSRFDVVAVQEVRKSLAGLDRLDARPRLVLVVSRVGRHRGREGQPGAARDPL